MFAINACNFKWLYFLDVLFGKAKTRTPQVSPAPPIPEVGEEVEDIAKRRARQRRGFRKTLITGALEPQTGKKRLLG